jgi:hypothetical protein
MEISSISYPLLIEGHFVCLWPCGFGVAVDFGGALEVGAMEFRWRCLASASLSAAQHIPFRERVSQNYIDIPLDRSSYKN